MQHTLIHIIKNLFAREKIWSDLEKHPIKVWHQYLFFKTFSINVKIKNLLSIIYIHAGNKYILHIQKTYSKVNRNEFFKFCLQIMFI